MRTVTKERLFVLVCYFSLNKQLKSWKARGLAAIDLSSPIFFANRRIEQEHTGNEGSVVVSGSVPIRRSVHGYERCEASTSMLSRHHKSCLV